ncbi:MAG: dihydrolipoyllysine-residue acetyltransferase [Gammaproteobacteria bacterium CG11_big_fil_rev_8_21_14_0_20_46_22]|nr:MAG: dihydrolipoyllysine-residue acetyltransferase [Gammaproteobacteria bacterium CG12_big_fil_rev_8_21_14_0_65_46_12]PIR11996.1 MAG: dihydrolipoyllysine-residue acetyltransferase [Gammaproteobacteria bacterium CG11_big_fil_rev_8_21_14_0_20_46_22]
MSQVFEVKVPDIGGSENVEVIEVLVKSGDAVKAEDSLLTLESDKATMDVPAPKAGVIKDIKIKVGDKVSEGSLIMTMDAEGEVDEAKKSEDKPAEKKAAPEKASTQSETASDITLPDLGTDDAVEVIEVHVKAGDSVKAEAALLTLESDKATMDVPAPRDGEIQAISIKVGDKVKTGQVIGQMSGAPADQTGKPKEDKAQAVPAAQEKPAEKAEAPASASLNQGNVYAGPGVRRLANELGVNLASVSGTGPKGRILREDLTGFAKQRMTSGGGAGLSLAEAPVVDFAKFGEVETQALSRIKKLSGKFLHRNWVTIPHVTQFDEADITDLEAFRQANKAVAEKQGAKLTPLVFIMKAVVAALKAYPQFNASLDASGENLVLKKYFHIGVAVDTPNGLVVPVIRDVDQKGFVELAKELAEFSKKARDGKLTPADMQGGCFSISSLGGIGGTAFTPIVNAPEVAILGVSKSDIKPKFIDGEFKPRLMLPLSLSYDHRVIDGADAARFVVYLAQALEDMRRVLL